MTVRGKRRKEVNHMSKITLDELEFVNAARLLQDYLNRFEDHREADPNDTVREAVDGEALAWAVNEVMNRLFYPKLETMLARKRYTAHVLEKKR